MTDHYAHAAFVVEPRQNSLEPFGRVVLRFIDYQRCPLSPVGAVQIDAAQEGIMEAVA